MSYAGGTYSKEDYGNTEWFKFFENVNNTLLHYRGLFNTLEGINYISKLAKQTIIFRGTGENGYYITFLLRLGSFGYSAGMMNPVWIGSGSNAWGSTPVKNMLLGYSKDGTGTLGIYVKIS